MPKGRPYTNVNYFNHLRSDQRLRRREPSPSEWRIMLHLDHETRNKFLKHLILKIKIEIRKSGAFCFTGAVYSTHIERIEVARLRSS